MTCDRSTPYAIGQLHQACAKCDWQQSRHMLELTHCPRCGAPVDYHRAAIEFGGLQVTFDGTRFSFRDRMGGCVEVDEADYPDTILFMQRHARFSYFASERVTGMTHSDSSRQPPARVQVKRYGSGKYYLYADAASEHLGIVEHAVIAAAKVCIVFDDAVFRTTLRKAGVADCLIEQYLDSVGVIDDLFGMGKNPG